MSNNLTNAYALHAELTEIQKSLADEKATLRANKYAQQFFTVTTWIIYLLFAAAMYAAPLWVLQSFFTANSGNWVAITVLSVFLVGFPTALALGKHGGYKALSKRGVDPRWMGAIIAFFIASGIYFEITSATSQQQEKAHQQAATTLGAAITAPPTVAIDTSLADKIAKASKKLAQCQANLGKPGYKHCDGDKADVASLQASQAAASAASVQAVGVAVNAQQERMERERDSNALPIAKSFSELFGSTLATGAVIAALIASLIFEVSHSLTIYNEWRIKREIDVLQGQLKQLKINYFHQTGKQFDSTDFREGEIIDLVSMRENGKIEHFNDRLQDGVSPAPAAAKNDGAYSGTKIGFTANRSDDRPFYGFDDPKKQAALDALNLATGSEDRKTLGKRTTNLTGKPDKPRQTENYPCNTRTDSGDPCITRTEPDYTEHLKRYTEANAAKVGQAVGCPWCGTQFTKKTYNHRFCCPAHKDEFWNAVKPERLEAKARKQRG